MFAQIIVVRHQTDRLQKWCFVAGNKWQLTREHKDKQSQHEWGKCWVGKCDFLRSKQYFFKTKISFNWPVWQCLCTPAQWWLCRPPRGPPWWQWRTPRWWWWRTPPWSRCGSWARSRWCTRYHWRCCRPARSRCRTRSCTWGHSDVCGGSRRIWATGKYLVLCKNILLLPWKIFSNNWLTFHDHIPGQHLHHTEQVATSKSRQKTAKNNQLISWFFIN